MSLELLDDLKSALVGSPRPLIVCGAGVTVYSAEHAPSWKDLIESGIDYVLKIGADAPEWAAYARIRLDKNDVQSWLDVADEITKRLGGSNGAEMSTWIYAALGGLKIKNDDLLKAIIGLNCPIATTNYDNLLSSVSNRPPVSWDNPDTVVRIARGEQDGIIHLHGCLSIPKSIILGTESYENLTKIPSNNNVRIFQSLHQDTVFVGCSLSGINDPDFTNISQLLSTMPGASRRRYFLQNSKSELKLTDANTNIYPIEYGLEYDQLPKFITSLTLRSDNGDMPIEQVPTTIDQVAPKKAIFGRESSVSIIKDSILSGGHALISGGPGFGKTALAVSVLYSSEISSRFGERRFFVSLENREDARSILSNSAEIFGLPSTGDSAALLRQLQIFASKGPIVVIIDNAEGVFENDFMESERVLSLTSQIPNFHVILTMRGILPIIDNAVVIADLEKLDKSSAKSAFIAISGPKAAENSIVLDAILTELDGHALSITIVAGHARKTGEITDVHQQWRSHKIAILKRAGLAEGRLTSVRASLAMSLNSKAITKSPLSKRILSLLAELPDGLSIKNISKVLSQNSMIPKAKILEAVQIIADAQLVEVRPYDKVRMLTPLRECVKLDKPIAIGDIKAVIKLYTKLILANSLQFGKNEAFVLLNLEPLNAYAICALAFKILGPSYDAYNLLRSYFIYISKSGQSIDPFWENVIRSFVRNEEYEYAADLYERLGLTEYYRGNTERAKELLLQAIPLLRQCPTSHVKSNVLHDLGMCEVVSGNLELATKYFEDALAAAETAGRSHLVGVANAKFNLGEVEWHRGNIEAAEKLLNETLILYKQIDDKLGYANVQSMLARMLRRDEFRLLNESLNAVKEEYVNGTESVAYIALGDYWYRMGDVDAAITHYSTAVTVARFSGIIGNEAFATIRLGQAAIAAGRDNSGTRDIIDGFNLYFSLKGSQASSGQGFIHMKEALLAKSQVTFMEETHKAAESWKANNRFDLIREWIDFRFGQDRAVSG